jgi:pectate lyase
MMMMKQKKSGLFTWVTVLALVCTLGFLGCPTPTDSNGNDTPNVPQDVRAGVWYETAYAEWGADPADTRFNVQFRLNGGGWRNVDDELVRKIDTTSNTWRVDVPGLLNIAGTSYDIRILDAAGKELHLVTGLVPEPFDRQGYAFSPNPGNSVTTTTGGYNRYGTAPHNAQIIYLTNENMNTVLMSGAFTGTTPVIIRVIGKVGTQDDRAGVPAIIQSATVPAACSTSYMYSISSKSNITIEGIGPDAYIEGWGFSFSTCNNVVVRNLRFDHWYDDAIYLNNTNNSWVGHNTFGYGVNRFEAGLGEQDHVKGDGATDIGNASTHFTVSYNKYLGSGKSMLIGGGTSAAIGHGSVHHNWFKETDERTPRLRNGWVHVFNNIYDDVGPEPGEGKGYGIGAGHRSNIVSEGNTFIHTYRPYIISGELSSNAAGPNVDGNINTLSNDSPGVIITSLYTGSPSAFDLTGRNLVPDALDDWSKDSRWYFEEELILSAGPTISNNHRGLDPDSLPAELTYTFVPFHTATSYRTDGSSGGAPYGASPSATFAARVPINDTLSSIGVQSAADGAASVRQYAGVMPTPDWW